MSKSIFKVRQFLKACYNVLEVAMDIRQVGGRNQVMIEEQNLISEPSPWGFPLDCIDPDINAAEIPKITTKAAN